MMVKARSCRPLGPGPQRSPLPSFCHSPSLSKPPIGRRRRMFEYRKPRLGSEGEQDQLLLAQERFQSVQQCSKRCEKNPGPAFLLQLVLWLIQSSPKLRNHRGGQTHLQSLQQPAAQQLAQTLTTEQGQGVREALLGHHTFSRHLQMYLLHLMFLQTP